MFRHIDADYYGFRDDEDGILQRLEVQAEKKMRTEVGVTPGTCTPGGRRRQVI